MITFKSPNPNLITGPISIIDKKLLLLRRLLFIQIKDHTFSKGRSKKNSKMTLTTFEDIFFPEKVHVLKSKKIPDVKRFQACSNKGGSF